MFKVLIYGHRGFIGRHALKYLTMFQVVEGVADCLKITELTDEIEQVKPNAVFVAVGRSGAPASVWHDQHPIESIEGNLVTAVNLVKATQRLNVRMLVVGTAFVQAGFGNEDSPLSPAPNFYSWIAAIRERLFCQQPNTLILRINYPLSLDDDPAGLLSKIRKFSIVHNVKSSITILDDLFQHLPKLLTSSYTGVLNFVNPGPLSPADIADIFGWDIPVNHDVHPVEYVQSTERLEQVVGSLKNARDVLVNYSQRTAI